MQPRLNSYLYSATGDLPIQYGKEGYQVQVELYNTDNKIEHIAAYTFHPNQTTWWGRLIDWFIEIFYGRTALLIRVEGEPSALYVRVDDLSHILNLSSEAILRASKKEEVTDFLIEHQMNQTAKKIKMLVEQKGIPWTALEQNSIKELIEEFGYHNVFQVLDDHEFDAQRMALTLIEVGKQLAQYSVDTISPTAYDFKVSLPNASVWKIEGFKKTQISLKNLILTEEDLLKQTVDKICQLAKLEELEWTQIEQESIETLIRKIGYQGIVDVINNNHFHAGRMACTLLEAGRKLAGFPETDLECKNVYEFEVNLPHLYVWKIENYKKIKVDVGNFAITYEDLPSPVVSANASPSKTPTLARSRGKMKAPTIFDKLTKIFMSPDAQELEFKTFIMGLQLDSKKMKYLASLADRVGYSNLTLILEHLSDEEKNIMVNTFIQIGQHLSMPALLDGIFANFRLTYVGQQKEGKKRLTHAFAINKNDIFIVQEKLGEGTFKIISNSIKLNDLENPFVRIKIKNDKEDQCIQGLKQTRLAVREVRKEAKFIELLHKNNKEIGSDCIVLPFACELVSDKEKNSVIFFQKKYDGNGEKLQKAPLFQIVHVLRDVAKGLAFIHKLGFVHLDVKPANFLIEGDIAGVIPVKGKVTDFGLSREIGHLLPGGSFSYLAPESLSHTNNKIRFNSSYDVDDRLDSFAFGVSILEALNKFPNKFLGMLNQTQINDEIEQYKQEIRGNSSKKEEPIKLALLELAHKLVRWHPKQRMSCTVAASQLEEIAQGRVLKMLAP